MTTTAAGLPLGGRQSDTALMTGANDTGRFHRWHWVVSGSTGSEPVGTPSRANAPGHRAVSTAPGHRAGPQRRATEPGHRAGPPLRGSAVPALRASRVAAFGDNATPPAELRIRQFRRML